MGTIVVGVDGSRHSLAALRWAVHEAALRGAEVRAVYVWPWPYERTELGHLAGELVQVPEEHAAQRDLDAAIETAGVDGASLVRRQVLTGAPSRRLIELAADAELLVLGARGHGGFAGLLLGSVSAQCAQGAACPVVIVHDEPTLVTTQPKSPAQPESPA